MTSFRSQLALEEQRRLYDVWREAAGTDDMPTRARFQPRAFGPLLPFVSLVELCAGGDSLGPAGMPRLRVAGSALRDVFGGDLRSALLDPAAPGGLQAWLRVAGERRPLCGADAAVATRPGGARFWMRLPLGDSARVEAVLGLDLNVSGARAPQWALRRMEGG